MGSRLHNLKNIQSLFLTVTSILFPSIRVTVNDWDMLNDSLPTGPAECTPDNWHGEGVGPIERSPWVSFLSSILPEEVFDDESSPMGGTWICKIGGWHPVEIDLK